MQIFFLNFFFDVMNVIEIKKEKYINVLYILYITNIYSLKKRGDFKWQLKKRKQQKKEDNSLNSVRNFFFFFFQNFFKLFHLLFISTC